MANQIIPTTTQSQSPFDSIRRYRSNGAEYWLATELLALLGYKSWKRQQDTVERAIVSCKNSGQNTDSHFANVVQIQAVGDMGGKREVIRDYELSRYACYLTAMNGDPRKPEVAAAQSYFAVKAREAETVIPIQNQELEALRLQVKLRELDNTMLVLHGKETVLALRGLSDQIVQSDRPILEVINPKTGQHFAGQTCKQVAEYIQKRTGKRLKSGAEVERFLRTVGRDDLIQYIERPAKQACIPKENLQEVYDLLTDGDRQRLIGEGA